MAEGGHTKHMKHNEKRIAAIGLALTIALAAVAGVAMAAPGSIDGTQTDTTDTVYISDGKTMDTEFNASGDTEWNLTIQSVPDADKLEMNVTHDGVEYYAQNGSFGSYNDGDPDADTTTNGRYVNFSDSELKWAPVDPNSNHTFTVNYWNANASNPTPTSVTVYVETTGERNIQRVTSSAAFAEYDETSPPVYKGWQSDYNYTEVDDSPEINGSDTTVTYRLADADTRETFQNTTDDISTDGTFTFMVANVEGSAVPVFYGSGADGWDLTDDGSYAVYDSGANTLTFHLSDELDGQTQADVLASSDVYRLTDAYTVYQLQGFSGVMSMAL